jgi:putative copper export protein
MIVVSLFECLIYLCFAYLTGAFIFFNLPKSKWPDNQPSRKLLLFSILGIGLFSFAPVFSVILDLAKDMGFWLSFKGVLFTFEIGQTWLLTFAISILLFLLVYFNPIDQDPILAKFALFLAVLLIGTYTKGGHAASLSPLWGFVGHFSHLLAVSVWGGCLMHAAWTAKSDKNWLAFLKWFTPLALISMIVIIGAGFLTMVIDISPPLNHSVSATLGNYRDGLVVNYGQALLIKHLLLIPLLLLATFNSVYSRKQFKQQRPFQPIKWARLETILLFAILAVTAYMGQQAPPHDLAQLLHFNGASPLFEAIYGGTIPQSFTVHLHFGSTSLIFILFSVLLLILVALGVVRRLSMLMVGGLILSYCVSSYFAILLAVR